jgi:anti-sigma regulatory factor (Ser/Thr protein kinase)
MPSKTVSIKLKNRISELERLDQKLQAFGASIGLSKKYVFQINLAVDELFTNIVKYGFADNNLHYVAITLSHRDGKISIRVEDNGVPFDPAAKQTSELKDPLEHCKIGGLGLHLVKKIMDDIIYERRGEKNVITLIKNIPRT